MDRQRDPNRLDDPPMHTFESGAKRVPVVAGQDGRIIPRFDLISPRAMLRIATTYGEGAIKYGERNWEKGLPPYDLMNRVFAHLNAFQAGDRSEDHLAHATWNLMALMHFEDTPS